MKSSKDYGGYVDKNGDYVCTRCVPELRFKHEVGNPARDQYQTHYYETHYLGF